MEKVYLAKGEVLNKRRYDVEYLGNAYKYVDGQWYIFANESLFPVTDNMLLLKLHIFKQKQEQEIKCDTCQDTGVIVEICSNCSGSGENGYDGSTCFTCGGRGEEAVECPEPDCNAILKGDWRL